jgi:hypothetical protein
LETTDRNGGSAIVAVFAILAVDFAFSPPQNSHRTDGSKACNIQTQAIQQSRLLQRASGKCRLKFLTN